MLNANELAERLAPALTGKTVAARLAYVLLELATQHGDGDASQGADLPSLTQPDLAQLVGAGEPAVHRALRQFRDAGLVETGYRRLTVLDVDGLREIARGKPEPPAARTVGPTGERVARRLGELRRSLGLTLADLEARLGELGRPILLSTLSKIENGQRRVDTDDLLAIARALDVSPNMILFPGEVEPSETVVLTETHTVDASEAWHWATRDTPTGAEPAWDFFISYTSADRAWAEWIAWQLEDAGQRVLVQAWDFVPGTNFVAQMRDAVGQAQRTVAVLSFAYSESPHTTAEWQAAFRSDPAGTGRRVLPVRVERCEPPDPLAALTYVDLFDLSPEMARDRLLQAVIANRAGRTKPPTEPAFPRTVRGISTSISRGDAPPARKPSDLDRSRLLLGWLAARRAVDKCLSDLLSAGPAGERRVREGLDLVDDLETRAQAAFDRYRAAAETTDRLAVGEGEPKDVWTHPDHSGSRADRMLLEIPNPGSSG